MAEQSTELSSKNYESDAADPVKGIWILLGVIVLIIGAFVFLRTQPSDITNADQLAVMVTSGRPTVIEFYSNF